MPEEIDFFNPLHVRGVVKGSQATGPGEAVMLGDDLKVPADMVPTPDMSGYVRDDELATVAKSGAYADLTGKPTIPPAYTLPVAGSALGGVKNGGNVSVDGSGNMNVDLSGYATKGEIPDTSGFETSAHAAATYATKSEIPDTSGFETTQHASATYATKSEVTSGLGGKVDKVSGSRLMTDAEGTKLGNIAAGAQVNVIESVKRNGAAVPVSGKAVDIAVPTKTSDLQNDSGFITQSALAGLAKVARAQVTGNGSSKTLSVSHQLGAVPIVYIYKGGQQYLTDIASTSTQVTLSFNTAPASGTVFDLILIG